MAGMIRPALVTVPPAGANTPALFSTSVATIGATTIITLSFGEFFAFGKLGMVRMKVKRIAGTAANFTPYIFSEAGVTTPGDISQEYAGSATAVATLFDPQLADAPVVMQCDAEGKLYFMPGPDAGADNQFEYAFRFLAYGP
jgi:hypothetical protein